MTQLNLFTEAGLTVAPVRRDDTRELILTRHYAGKMPQAKYSFGLFQDGEMVGVCTYSIPASYTLCRGVCGPENHKRVLELSRLVLNPNTPLWASRLVGQSLRQIPGSWVVVSYADPNHGHVGIPYQATNWLYTGTSTAEPWWYHPETGELISKTRRHIDKKAEKFGLKWTDLRKSRKQGKHRYVTFVGDRREKRHLRRCLKYPVQDYPKR